MPKPVAFPRPLAVASALAAYALALPAQAAPHLAAPHLVALPVAMQEVPRIAPAAVALWAAPEMPLLAVDGSVAATLVLEGSAGSDGLRRTNRYSGNYFVVAAGVASVPEFEGARTRSLTPAVGVMGRIGPVSFSPRAAGIAFNIVPNRGQRWVLSAGPVLRYQSDRHGRVHDPVVAALGRLPATFEVGFNTSVAYHGLITRADALSLGMDVRTDVTGHDGGTIVGTSLGYYTPVSRGVLVGASAFADFVDARYARFHYGVTPAGSVASGLPVYRPKGGLKDLGAQGVLVVDLNGDLLDGGAAMLAGVSWNALQGSAARSPIVQLRGTPSQLTYGGGLAYSF